MSPNTQSATGRNATAYLEQVGRFLNDRSKPVKDSSHADSWYSKCTQKIDQEFKDNATSQESIAKGLVMTIHGERLLEVDEPKIDEAWGFSLSVCKDYCSRDHINMVKDQILTRIAAVRRDNC